MPYAKEPLYIGDICIARVGRFVSQSAVDRYLWHDKVDDDPVRMQDPVTTVELPAPAPKPTRRRKGA